MEWVILFILSYLLGSLSSAVWVCRWLKLPDPRTQGSGNPGATNVLRLSGRLPAGLILLLDIGKGLLPVLVAQALSDNPWLIGVVLLSSVAGHWYPLFFQFKGGKGVATALGGLMGLSLPLAGVFIVIWLLVFALSRYSSLSALLAMTSMPFVAGLLDKRYSVILALLALMVVWRHRSNIQRLYQGKEGKLK